MSWKLKVPQATKQGYIEVGLKGCFDYAYPQSKLRRGRVQGGGESHLHYVQRVTDY